LIGGVLGVKGEKILFLVKNDHRGSSSEPKVKGSVMIIEHFPQECKDWFRRLKPTDPVPERRVC
jgi:hypothetical protein